MHMFYSSCLQVFSFNYNVINKIKQTSNGKLSSIITDFHDFSLKIDACRYFIVCTGQMSIIL